jgi:hypothetical protein
MNRSRNTAMAKGSFSLIAAAMITLVTASPAFADHSRAPHAGMAQMHKMHKMCEMMTDGHAGMDHMHKMMADAHAEMAQMHKMCEMMMIERQPD